MIIDTDTDSMLALHSPDHALRRGGEPPRAPRGAPDRVIIYVVMPGAGLVRRVGADGLDAAHGEPDPLLARLEALLRETADAPAEPVDGDAVERFGSIEVHRGARTVARDGRLVALSPLEFDLLVALLRRRGTVASRAELLREVWRGERPPTTRTLDTHILNLRRKLEDEPARPRHILTANKVGYRLAR
jgi:DNA-binding response OmpR family regulator